MTTLVPTVAQKLPAGPQSPPFIQSLHWLIRPFSFMEDCKRQYGDCFTIRFWGFKPIVFFSHPQAIKDILTAGPNQFQVAESNKILRPLVGAHSIFLLDGAAHQRQRQLLMPPFHGERMRAYGQLICQITEQVTSHWSMGQSFAVLPTMQEITLQVIMRAIFGIEEGKVYDELKPLLKDLLESTASPLKASLLFISQLQQNWGAWSPWGHFLRQRSQIDQLLYQLIDERRSHADPDRNDILTLLLSARDETGQPMTDEELRDELLTMLLAGNETTAFALAWAFYWIHSTPGVLDKLLMELNLDQESTAPIALTRLPYLTAVCKETLRIRPVAPIAFGRITQSRLRVMGHEFEPGTSLAPCIYLTHQRPDLYPDADQFRPERFLEHQFSPYEYLPFGGGDRLCIGMAFAQFEMKLVIATILARFRLTLAHQKPIKPSRRGVILAPASNFRMVATEIV